MRRIASGETLKCSASIAVVKVEESCACSARMPSMASGERRLRGAQPVGNLDVRAAFCVCQVSFLGFGGGLEFAGEDDSLLGDLFEFEVRGFDSEGAPFAVSLWDDSDLEGFLGASSAVFAVFAFGFLGVTAFPRRVFITTSSPPDARASSRGSLNFFACGLIVFFALGLWKRGLEWNSFGHVVVEDLTLAMLRN